MSEFQINRIGGIDLGKSFEAQGVGAMGGGMPGAAGGLDRLAGGAGPVESPLPVGEAGKTFSEMLRKSVDQVNEHQVQADTAVKELLAGRNKNIHETMLALERADSSLKLMMQVRNKVLEAYKEIMRMQV